MPILAMSAGTVTAIWGNAFIRQADGSLKPVKVGDKVAGGEHLITDADGLVQISPAKGHPVLLKAQTDAPAVDKAIAAADAQDPQEAPAAGLTGGADGGMQPGLRVERVSETVSSSLPTANDAATGAQTGAVQTGSSADQRALPSTTSLPQASIDDISVNEGSRTATFTVTLDKASTGTVTIPFSTQGDTASSGDFTPIASGTLTFQPGETSKTITVAITNDGIYEGVERFTVQLGAPVNATLGKGEGVAQIHDDGTGTVAAGGTVDDDRPHVASVSGAQATEGGTLAFHVKLSNDSTTDTPLVFKLIGQGGLVPAEDLGDVRIYQGPNTDGPPLHYEVASDGSLLLTVPKLTPANTEFIVQVDTKADSLVEGTETVQLAVSTPHDANPVLASGTIADATVIVAPEPTHVLSVSDAQAAEGGALDFHITLSHETTTATPLVLTLTGAGDHPVTLGEDTDPTVIVQQAVPRSDGTGFDYLDLAYNTDDQGNLRLDVPPSVAGADIIVRVITRTDTLLEGPETLQLAASTADDTISVVATGLIDDNLPYTITGEPNTEGGHIGFNVTMTQASTVPVTVHLALASGVDDPYTLENEAAKLGEDTGTTLEWESAPGVWQAVTGPLSFQPGDTLIHVRLATVDDQAPEVTEFIKLLATFDDPRFDQPVTVINQTAIDDNDPWLDPVSHVISPPDASPLTSKVVTGVLDHSDTFAWHLSDHGVDTLGGFDTRAASVGGDVLDLRDVLHGEEKVGADLTHFLHFDTSGADTVIKIAAEGDMVDGHSAFNVDTQHIVLEGVNLPMSLDLGAGASDAQIIAKLMTQGNLLVDHA